MMRQIAFSFISMFIALNAIGAVPIFVEFTKKYSAKKKRKTILQAVITATCLPMIFLFLGDHIFNFLGITRGDFLIAGGLILFCIAMVGILGSGKKGWLSAEEASGEDIGAAPIGTPLLAGPAFLTVSLINSEAYGLGITFCAVLVNVAIAGVFFLLSTKLIKVLTVAGLQVLSKITCLLLAAIAVMLIRMGIDFIAHIATNG
ncbi:MAG: MarC family protein [Candidatus Omnitrophota bacterium]